MDVSILFRYQSDDQGTLGLLITQQGISCFILELPDRNNKTNMSRIPAGEYLAKWHRSPRFGLVYWLQDVQGRTAILTHAGNLAGDTTKGFKTHSYGCLLFGSYRGVLQSQKAVLASRPAMHKYHEATGKKDHIIRIVEVGNA